MAHSKVAIAFEDTMPFRRCVLLTCCSCCCRFSGGLEGEVNGGYCGWSWICGGRHPLAEVLYLQTLTSLLDCVVEGFACWRLKMDELSSTHPSTGRRGNSPADKDSPTYLHNTATHLNIKCPLKPARSVVVILYTVCWRDYQPNATSLICLCWEPTMVKTIQNPELWETSIRPCCRDAMGLSNAVSQNLGTVTHPK